VNCPFYIVVFQLIVRLLQGDALYKILLAGQDSRLLSRRAAVLNKISDHVVSCNVSEALQFLESQRPNLVILCHSLPVEDAERIADKAHQRGEGTRVLMLVSDMDTERQQGGGKFDAVTLPEPAQLITRTTELLQGSSDHRFEEPVIRQRRRARA
jgi:CheY-like chemotaxis protein